MVIAAHQDHVGVLAEEEQREGHRRVFDEEPATSSDSPSGRSKGERLVSASVEMKKITNIGSSGMQNQTVFCARRCRSG